jgi:hypothetical protein
MRIGALKAHPTLLPTGVIGKGGLGGKNHQMPNPPLGADSPKMWRKASTYPMHAVLGTHLGCKTDYFTISLVLTFGK